MPPLYNCYGLKCLIHSINWSVSSSEGVPLALVGAFSSAARGVYLEN